MVHKRKHNKRIHKGYSLGDLNMGVQALTIQSNPERTSEWPFRLCDLPDELVLRVLEYAVVSSSLHDPIDIAPIGVHLFRSDNANGALGTVSEGKRTYRKAAMPLVQPAITRTNRLLRIEGLKLFYEKNYFRTSSCDYGRECADAWFRILLDFTNVPKVPRLSVEWRMYFPINDSSNHDGKRPIGYYKGMDFIREMQFMLCGLREDTVLPASARVRFENGKVVLWCSGHGDEMTVSYRIAFIRSNRDTRRWKSYVQAKYGNLRGNPILKVNSKDFWVNSKTVEKID